MHLRVCTAARAREARQLHPSRERGAPVAGIGLLETSCPGADCLTRTIAASGVPTDGRRARPGVDAADPARAAEFAGEAAHRRGQRRAELRECEGVPLGPRPSDRCLGRRESLRPSATRHSHVGVGEYIASSPESLVISRRSERIRPWRELTRSISMRRLRSRSPMDDPERARTSPSRGSARGQRHA